MIDDKFALTGKVLSVYDGDSITCDVTYPIIKNQRLVNTEKIRIYGVDTPEINGSSEAERDAGKRVRDYLKSLIELHEVEVIILDDSDKYGRLLSYVSIEQLDITEHLLSIGYAKEYYGGKKEPWSKEELDYILNN